MLSLLVSLVVVGLIVWVLLWALAEVGLPEPFAKVAKVVIVLFAAIWLINLLMPLAGNKSLF